MSQPINSDHTAVGKRGFWSFQSLNAKLVLLITSISFLVVMLTIVVATYFETVTIRKQLMESYQTTVRMEASNLEAAVVFNDRHDAEEILNTLAHSKSFRQANLITRDGSRLFVFKHPDQLDEPQLSPEMETRFTGLEFYINEPINVNNQEMARLLAYGKSDEFLLYLKTKFIIVVSMLLLSLVVAFIIANRMSKLIIGPILKLAETAKTIKEHQDFSLRQSEIRTDELGVLIDSFNEMMDQIEKQNDIIYANAQRFRGYFDLGIVGLGVLDTHLNLIEQNNRFLEIFKCSCDDLAEHNWIECIETESEDFREQIEALKRDSISEYTGECWFRGKEGSFYAIISIRTIPESKTENRHFLILVQDITERKTYEEALLSAKEKAEASNKAKDEFLSVMSHELRTPLNPIIGYTDLIKMESNDPEIIQCADSIRNAGNHLLNIINSILDYTRIDKGMLHPEYSLCDIEQISGEVVTMVKQHYQTDKLSFDVSHRVHNPSKVQHSGRMIVTDRTKLIQLMLNLVENACKFTQEGSIELKTCLDIKTKSNALFSVEISDTGPGISEQDIGRIFKPFHQLDSSMTRKHGGIGLGLAICVKIIKLFGGDIRCESQPGKGTTFFFSYQVRLGLETTKPNPLGHLSSGVLSNKNGKILLVEDDPVNQDLTIAQLKRLGYHVDVASDGNEGVQMASKENYDLILMDLQLPELNGFDATRKIRETQSKSQNTPIIAVTAHEAIISKGDCLEVGMNDFLSKPFNINQLEHKITSCWDWSRSPLS